MINDAHAVYNIVSSLFSLLVVWWLVFFAFRDYRIDAFRDKLFRLREDLFLFAAGGGIEFDQQAYRMLRQTIDGTIRYGDRVGITWLWFLSRAFKHEECRDVEDLLHAEWRHANKSLAPAAKKRLLALRRELHWILLSHVLTSPGIILFAFPVLIDAVRSQIRARVERWIEPTLNRVDSVALLEAREASRQAA